MSIHFGFSTFSPLHAPCSAKTKMPGPVRSAQLPEEQVDHGQAASKMTVPKDLSFPLRLSPYTTLHIQLTLLATSTLILLTTRTQSSSSSNSALGSFVYAMPNVPLPVLDISHAFTFLLCMLPKIRICKLLIFCRDSASRTRLSTVIHPTLCTSIQHRICYSCCKDHREENEETYIRWLQCFV